MKYKAVFFDAGETLLSPHPSFHELFAAVASEFGQTVSPDAAEQAFASLAPSFVEVMDKMGIQSWSTSREASEAFWGKVYAAGFDKLGLKDPGGAMASALYERFTRYESYRLFPDAVPTLKAARRAGMIVGLISNFEEWLEGMLIEMQVHDLFDLMVVSGKEGIEKPDPAIFRLALDRSSSPAETSVYVGDHPRIDAAGAEAVGMTGVLIDRKGLHPHFNGTRIFGLDELLPTLMAH